MSERKINLDSLWKKKFPHSKLPDYAKEIAMEFAKELLELAAENAFVDNNHEQGCCISSDDFEVNKQSILNIINQIE